MIISYNRDDYQEEIPEVFFILTYYFEKHPLHLKQEGLFRLAGDTAKINELNIHLSLRDFAKLGEMNDCPNEIANFLKEILREMTEPVCPFSLYPKFRDMDRSESKENKLELILEYLQMMPTLNRSTMLYLVKFFAKVCTFSQYNKMPAYNLAVVLTPNLFRSKDLTPKDLQNHGTLVDCFILMMENYNWIID